MPHRFALSGVDFTVLDQPPFVDQDFTQASMRFFDKAEGDTSLHDLYFSRWAAPINSLFFPRELWHKAEQVWQIIVQPALSWEASRPGWYIHKGTPFYFWGMAAISRGELDMGYPLMHQALQEDIRTHDNPCPRTPAYAFATLDYTNVDQAFRNWTEFQIRFLRSILETYQTAFDSSLSLDDFRARFLVASRSLDIVLQFTYVLARFSLFDRVPVYARQSDFASQLELSFLFELARVIDASIKVLNPETTSFSLHITYVAERAGLGLTQKNIQDDLNQAFQSDLDLTLRSILDGSFCLPCGTGLAGLARDLAIAYGVRNYGAHRLSAVPVIRQHFGDICQSLFNVLFLTVEILY